jgi:hypothetical protein
MDITSTRFSLSMARNMQCSCFDTEERAKELPLIHKQYDAENFTQILNIS